MSNLQNGVYNNRALFYTLLIFNLICIKAVNYFLKKSMFG